MNFKCAQWTDCAYSVFKGKTTWNECSSICIYRARRLGTRDPCTAVSLQCYETSPRLFLHNPEKQQFHWVWLRQQQIDCGHFVSLRCGDHMLFTAHQHQRLLSSTQALLTCMTLLFHFKVFVLFLDLSLNHHQHTRSLVVKGLGLFTHISWFGHFNLGAGCRDQTAERLTRTLGLTYRNREIISACLNAAWDE